uniref:phospholipase A2 n=1 Tax=Iconisemion striatum TaxID=60296 RepID=A0A1A7WAQ9_9TELE
MWSVFFVFLSYLDRNVVRGDFLSRAVDAEKESKEMFSMINGTFCAKMSVIGENYLYQVSDGAEVVRTVVSPAGKLVNCSVVVNRMEVKSFMHECRLGLRERRGGGRALEAPFTHMGEAKTMCREFRERSGSSGRARKGEKDEVLKRSKRGFTYPGTLWCGAGNMADNFNQLGEFAETDSCCRTHDHCPNVIHAFSSNYGYTNFKWHSICHCDCDEALKACLRKVNDTSSRVVGQAFFNVIGVPCFEFVHEERCAERHWYGLCKRYDKLPIAVVREAVPYDYGGIDVIDELTVAPPRRDEGEQPESVTQSSMSIPEEPSLRNVVTAAEDFIKVLATVSTSQSSNSDKDDAQSSEKKKKKNVGKKKKSHKKPKGKGRKRKQKSDAGVKTEEGAAGPPGSKTEEVLSLSNFIRESNRPEQSSINANRADDRGSELRPKDEPSNDVMKDEPAVEKEMVSVTPPLMVQKKLTKQETPLLTSTPVTSAKAREQRKCRRRKSKKTLPPCSEDPVLNAVISTPTAAPERPSIPEQEFHVSTAIAPVSTPKAKRNRSKEKADKEEEKKRPRPSSGAPIVHTDQSNSSEDGLRANPPTSSIPTPGQQRSHVYRNSSWAAALSYSVLKRHKSKERARRNRRRKTSENPLFSHGSSENVAPVLTAPPLRAAPVAAAQGAETHSEREHFTTPDPTVGSELRWDPSGQQDPIPVTLVTPRLNAAEVKEPWMTPTAPMSPPQVSVQKAKAQFNRKKRRKALHRQQ